MLDENDLPVSNIELSINKDGKEVKRTYTDINGGYVFSDLEPGIYVIKVEEDIYDIVSGSETSQSETNHKIKVKQVDKFNIETKKYIEKLENLCKVNDKVEALAIGEIGLDYHGDFKSEDDYKNQARWFIEEINLAKK